MKRIEHTEAQRIELDILVEFGNYCNRNGLRYYLAYGTLIGAIRHKGFIPWDNDVDVVMPRPDYEKLITMVKQDPISEYVHVLDYREERTFPFAKAVDTRTVCKEHFLVTEENMGLYIDIFPLDGMPNNKNTVDLILKKARVLSVLYALANYRFNTGSTTAVRMIKNMLYPVSRLISSKWVCEKLNSLCVAYPYEESDNVANVVWGDGQKDVMPKAWYASAVTGLFEKQEICIPVDYNRILTQFYGDYMQLPPEEDRVVHEFEAYWK